jgi:putative tricarboxylic transport membrane protein
LNAHHKREVAFGIAAAAIAAIGWFVVIPLGIEVPQNIKITALSPDFWPRIVMAILAIAGAVIAIQAFFESRGADPENAPANDEETVEHPPAVLAGRVIFALALLFVFYAGIFQLGIVVCSALIIVVFTFVLGQRQWKYILPLAVALPLVLYFFFVHVAQVPMPLGVFEVLR